MKIGENLSVMDDYRFPEQFWGDIENKTFAWVFANKSEWVDYTKNWENATGFFAVWRDYVNRKTIS